MDLQFKSFDCSLVFDMQENNFHTNEEDKKYIEDRDKKFIKFYNIYNFFFNKDLRLKFLDKWKIITEDVQEAEK